MKVVMWFRVCIYNPGLWWQWEKKEIKEPIVILRDNTFKRNVKILCVIAKHKQIYNKN